jgi:signal transduction histidine kinase
MGTSSTSMSTDKKAANTQAKVQSSIGMIAHDLANSINTVSSTIQLLERDLKNDQEHSLDLIGKVITTLKNQCSQMQIQLEELRRLSANPDEPVRRSKKGPR